MSKGPFYYYNLIICDQLGLEASGMPSFFALSLFWRGGGWTGII